MRLRAAYPAVDRRSLRQAGGRANRRQWLRVAVHRVAPADDLRPRRSPPPPVSPAAPFSR